MIKLKTENWNVSKRQQPDQIVEKSLRPPTGIQHSEKNLQYLFPFLFPFPSQNFIRKHVAV